MGVEVKMKSSMLFLKVNSYDVYMNCIKYFCFAALMKVVGYQALLKMWQ